MTNKKLIFIVGSPRSGTTLLLSYLCGLKNTKILYETKYLTNSLNFSPTNLVEFLANLFDSIEEEIVIEKTPEHVHYLDIVEQLRKICKRDIHVIYITRPPVPTVLSILKAKEALEVVDILGACEKYEESMISIYHNLVVKSNLPSYTEGRKSLYVYDWSDRLIEGASYRGQVINAYSFHVTYRSLTEDVYFTLYNLLVTELHLNLSDSDIRGLVVNRISNMIKVLPKVVEEKHHSNLFKEVDVVNKERLSNVSKLTEEDKRDIRYINNYFTNKTNKSNIYDLVAKKEVVDVKYVVKNNPPEVYVVVPLYNKEKYIEDTLTSIANQTYKNIRVIVIDDASTDNSYEVAEKCISILDPEDKDRFSLIKYEVNKEVSFIRNKGLSVCTDIISFCDADDIWDSTLVEKSVAIFKKYPYVDCVYSRVQLLKDGEVTKNHSKICNGDVYKDALEYNFLTCGSNIFVKTSVIKDHKIRFNTDYNGCEDWDFLIQLAKIATFRCTKEYLVTYRQLPNSLSSNKELQVDNGKKVLESYIVDNKKFSRIFTRLYLYYFSINNLKWEHIKDLDFSYILRVIVSKLKSFVKSYIS